MVLFKISSSFCALLRRLINDSSFIADEREEHSHTDSTLIGRRKCVYLAPLPPFEQCSANRRFTSVVYPV